MNLENAEPMVADESEKLAKQRPEEIARRYDNRAGYDLVSWRKVGLPVYKITVHALIQLHKSIPPIEEFVLKTIKAGLSSEQEIGGLLGLEFVLVREAIINLRTSEDINLKIVVPQARTFTIHFDGLLWHPHWYGQHLESSLLKPRELKQGMIEISPCQTQKPELSDLSLIEVDRIIEKIESESRRKVKREQDLLVVILKLHLSLMVFCLKNMRLLSLILMESRNIVFLNHFELVIHVILLNENWELMLSNR